MRYLVGRWIILGQLKRDRAPSEAIFRSLWRGDLIEVEGMSAKGTLFRLPPQGSLRRL